MKTAVINRCVSIPPRVVESLGAGARVAVL